MCILLYVKLIRCSGIPYIYGQLEEGAFMVYVKFGVVLFHTSMVNWRRGIQLSLTGTGHLKI